MNLLLLGAAAAAFLSFNMAYAASPKESKHQPQFLIKTSKGDITVQLDEDKAPETVKNFRQYAANKHYDNTIFHRVISDFMIQGGGFTPDMKQKPTLAPIKNEAQNGLTNQKYTIAMARTSDVNSATSQFFINTKDNPFLNNRSSKSSEFGYAVFGEVVKGKDVVDAIRKVPTGNVGGYSDVPKEPVVILEVKEIQ